MNLVKLKCNGCKQCLGIPLEIDNENKTDILIIDGFPKQMDVKEKRPFSTATGKDIRNVINIVKTKYNLNFSYTNFCKNKDHNKICHKSIVKEIELVKPKIIVFLGKEPHNEFWGTQSSIFVEENCVRNLKINNIEYKTISSVHPSSLITEDANCLGFLYRVLERASLSILGKGSNFIAETGNTIIYLNNLVKVKKFVNHCLNTSSNLSVDTETKNLNRVTENKILSVQFSLNKDKSYVIPLDHFDTPFDAKELIEVKKQLKILFTKPTKIKHYLYHNAKFDLHQFFRELHVLIYNAPIIDTSFSEYLLEETWGRFSKLFPQGKGPYSLYTVSYKYGYRFYSDTEGVSKDDRENFSELPIKDWLQYAGMDSMILHEVWRIQQYIAKLENYDGFYNMAVKFSTSMTRCLTYIEHCGLGVNINTLRNMYNPLTSPLTIQKNNIINELRTLPTVKKLERELKKDATGYSGSLFGTHYVFDIGKELHRNKLFFGENYLALESVKEDGKFSTDKEFQKVYKGNKEVDLFTEFQRMKSLQTLQINSIFEYMNKSTGLPDFYYDNRVRSSFFPLTVTGRLKSSSPNQQQRVSRGDRADEILKMYEAPEGKIYVKIDYVTFEVKGLGFISEDKNLIKSFNNMYKVKQEYRKNPYAFIEDKTKPKSCYDILIKGINRKQRWDTKDLCALLPVWLERFEFDEKIKSQFCKYVTSLFKTRETWILNELKSAITDAVKTELRRLLSYFAVQNKTDIHKSSAALFNKKPVEQVTKEERQNAKGFVFGLIYGRGIRSIALELGISEKEAQILAELFASNMSGAYKWMEDTKLFARTNYYVDSPIGRRRHLWGCLSSQKQILSKMDRLAQNSGIQGVCSDFNIIATSNVISYIHDIGKLKYQVDDKDGWLIMNLVHDSSENEIPTSDIREFIEVTEPFYTTELEKYVAKEYGFKSKVPLEIDYEIGKRYSDMSKWDGTEIILQRIIDKLI